MCAAIVVLGACASTVSPSRSDGSPTDALDGLESEVMLDVEVAAGVCPKAKLARTPSTRCQAQPDCLRISLRLMRPALLWHP